MNTKNEDILENQAPRAADFRWGILDSWFLFRLGGQVDV